MWRDKKEMRCPHTVEAVIEILSRSPHNRVLLRYNDFGRILLTRLKTLSGEIASLSASDESWLSPSSLTPSSSLLESLQTVTRTIYNFLPHLDHAAWLTQEGVFTPGASNLLGSLCSLFEAPPW